MQRNKGGLAASLLVMLLSAQIAVGIMVKQYKENYHRPTYYNWGHKQSMHVDYNREIMDQRDATTPGDMPATAVFSPKLHLSFYVHILYKASVFCVGTLITRRMVITSSRCFIAHGTDPSTQYKAQHMTVLTGNDFGTTTRKVWQVIAFFLPASTQESGDVHDIVLLALDRKLPPPKYRHISLFKKRLATGAKVQMAFVDATSHDITLYNTTVVHIDRCKMTYEQSGNIAIPFHKDLICVKNKKSGSCSSRPGDPLIIDSKLAGINLYGEHCDDLESGPYYDIYYAIRKSIRHIQHATDLLRAFTSTGPFHSSFTTKRTQLHQNTTY